MVDEFKIHCVRQHNGVITDVGIGDKMFKVAMVVEWILKKAYTFYTIKNNAKAPVYPKQSVHGNWFLTTNPDDTRENNLDFLGECPSGMNRAV